MKTVIRPETEMKESGASWMGKIPCEWSVSKLKWYLRRIDPRNPGDKQVLSLYREYGVIPKDSRDDNHNATSEDTSKYKYVRVGDFVVNKMKAWQGSVAVSEYDGIVSPAYYVYHFTDDSYHRRYFHYLLRSCYKEEFMRLSGGIRVGQWDLNSKDLDNVLIVIPKKEEQQAIADYLDETCSKIDEIIAEAKASIDEYENLRQSIIYEILTKGPDDNVEMKDSGVEWIGKVPSHWMIGKVKYGTTKVGSGKTPKGGAEVYMTSGVMFLRSQNIYNDGLRLDNPYYISEEIDEEMKNTRVQKNDVLLNITGGSIGRCCIFDGSIPNANVNQHVCIIRVNSSVFLPEYMHLFWISLIGQISIKSYQTGGNREGMSAEAIKNTPIPIIPIGEQRRIVDLIKPKIDDFNSLIAEKESLINDLEAYKKSLIYEMVTGKRRVV